jgi:adenylate cyclase
MESRLAHRRFLRAEAALTLAVIALVLLARYVFPLTARLAETIEARSIDMRFQVRGEWTPEEIASAGEKIAIVALDDTTMHRFGRVPPRAVHARLVRQLKRAGARAVIFDIIFADPDRTGKGRADDQFGRAVREAGNVFFPFDDNASQFTPPDVQKEIEAKLSYPLGLPPGAAHIRLQPPVAPLFRAMRGGGHVIAVPDADRVFRSAALLYQADATYPHVVLDAVARSTWKINAHDPLYEPLALQDNYLQIGPHRVGPLTPRVLRRSVYDGARQRAVWEKSGICWMLDLDFPGGSDVLESWSVPYLDALAGRADARLKNRVVIVGETATATTDLRPGPFDRNEITHGVETNATLLADLLENRFLRHAPFGWALAATLLCGLVAGLSVAAGRPWLAGGLALGVFALYAFAAFVLFAQENLVLELTAPLLAVFWCFTVPAGYRLWAEERAARQYKTELDEVEALLGQYVDKNVALELRDDPERRLAMQIGTRREVTILFCDIRDFTAWCETQPPEEVKTRLDEYLPLMCEIAYDDYGGFVDKFIGDELMVVWNAVLNQPDHAERAVRAALSMQRALRLLNDAWRKQKQAEFRIGIGIATGRVVFGTFGSPRHRLMATVLGDRVNLASRLEAMTKQTGSAIIISQETHDATRGQFETRPLGEVPIRGKSEPQPVYEVLGIEAAKTREVEV